MIAAEANGHNTLAAKMRPALVGLLAQHMGAFGLRVSTHQNKRLADAAEAEQNAVVEVAA